jgi:inhibitor of KinA
MYGQPRFLPAGDRALVVELGDGIDVATNARTRALAVAIDLRHLPGIVETVPTYRSLLIHYDPLQRRVEIPTVYGGEFGPDMPDVVAHTGLTEDEVVSIHASTDYLVYMMGFITGFPYLGGMSASIATPRLSTPRTKVPVGSVGIAQQQTGIYPVESPGGWRLIGRTPVRWFDPTRHPPVPVEAGDFIRFVPVSASDYERIRGLVQAGTYTVSAKACD